MKRFNYENSTTLPLPCGCKASWECGRVVAVSKAHLDEKAKVVFRKSVDALLPRGWEKNSPEIITLTDDAIIIIGDAV